jgi:hypothetical protein
MTKVNLTNFTTSNDPPELEIGTWVKLNHKSLDHDLIYVISRAGLCGYLLMNPTTGNLFKTEPLADLEYFEKYITNYSFKIIKSVDITLNF